MPTVEFNTRELIKLIGIDDIKFLKEKIPMIGVDMEHMDEEKTIIEIFPNRPDMLSIEGFARALKNFLGISKDVSEYKVIDSENKIFVYKNEIRPFISAGIVKNLTINDEQLKSLMDVQEKIHITHGRNRKKVAIGIHNLDVIKFPVFYKCAKPKEYKFIPLNFTEEMCLDEILIKHPKGKEYGKIISGYEKFPIIVDRDNNVISMPPIINADRTKVTTETKNLFIETTGTNQYAVEKALAIILSTLADMGGEIYNVVIQNER